MKLSDEQRPQNPFAVTPAVLEDAGCEMPLQGILVDSGKVLIANDAVFPRICVETRDQRPGLSQRPGLFAIPKGFQPLAGG